MLKRQAAAMMLSCFSRTETKSETFFYVINILSINYINNQFLKAKNIKKQYGKGVNLFYYILQMSGKHRGPVVGTNISVREIMDSISRVTSKMFF